MNQNEVIEVNFYGALIDKYKVVAKLLIQLKALNKPILVLLKDKEEVSFVDTLLWTSVSWLPHAKQGDLYENEHPILLSDDEYNTNTNNYTWLVLCNPSVPKINFKKLFIIFDQKSTDKIIEMRNTWKLFKEMNYNLKYYKQDSTGKFNLK